MSAISWNTTGPSSSSTPGDARLDFLSMMTSLATGVTPSFFWPGSGGGSAASAGELNFGTARCARAGGSAVTGGYGDGYLLLNTDHVSLHHIGSTATSLVGHSGIVAYADGAIASPQTTGILRQQGRSETSAGIKFHSFPTSFLTAPHFVAMSFSTTDLSTGFFCTIWASPTSSGFTSDASGVATPGSFAWFAEGLAAL